MNIAFWELPIAYSQQFSLINCVPAVIVSDEIHHITAFTSSIAAIAAKGQVTR